MTSSDWLDSTIGLTTHEPGKDKVFVHELTNDVIKIKFEFNLNEILQCRDPNSSLLLLFLEYLWIFEYLWTLLSYLVKLLFVRSLSSKQKSLVCPVAAFVNNSRACMPRPPHSPPGFDWLVLTVFIGEVVQLFTIYLLIP